MLRRVISLILCLVMLVSAVPVSVFAEETTEASEHQHVWDDGVVTEPNCVTAGCTTYTCATCGESYSDSEVPALGHSWGDWTVTAEPTAEAEGERERICSVCSAEETETIEMLSQPESVAVTSVAVSQERDYVEVLVTDTLQLTATVLPEDATDKTVTWSSSDDAIATVDSTGLVTGVSEGEVIITAACGDVQGSYALTVVMPASEVLADYSGKCGTSLTWTLSGTTLTISGSGKMDNYPTISWSTHAPWLDHNYSINKVVIESGVTSIGDYAFDCCSNLTNITIAEGVTSIGQGAFNGCTSLTSLTLPKSLTSIGSYAFTFCESLISVTIPEGITQIPNFAFSRCTKLEAVTIPASVTSISNNAFEYCESLTAVTIPEGVTSIAFNAFDSCTNLEEITLPVSLASIGPTAFHGCSKLTKVTYGGTLKQWNAISIGSENDPLLNATIECVPDPYSGSCGENLIWDFDPDTGTLTIIGTGAMEDYGPHYAPWDDYCSSITNVVLEGGITSIGCYAFLDCSKLTSVTIPESVTSISSSAFNSCHSLKEVTIPVSVTTIGGWAFEYCTSLSKVFYSGSKEQWNAISIGNGNPYLINAVVEQTPDLYFGRFSESLLWELDNTTGTLTISGTGAIADNIVTPWDTYQDTITAVVLEEGITVVGAYTFDEHTALKSISLPSTVTDLNRGAFKNCTGLTAVTIPRTVTTIYYEAFYGCNSLSDIVFGHEGSDALSISESAFQFVSQYWEDTAETKVTVPYVRIMPEAISGYDWYNARRTVTWVSSKTASATAITISAENNVTEKELGLSTSLRVELIPAYTTSELVWTVSDSDVGEIQVNGDSAVFVGKKVGTATVCCTSADDETIFGEIELTVLPPTGELTGISIRAAGTNPYEIDLSQPTQMVVDFEPGNASARDVTWELDEGTGSATIDENGLVTAMSPGTVAITATSKQHPEISYTLTVEILRYVDGITILLNSKENVTKLGVGETMTLSALVSPEDAKFQDKDVLWSVTNGTGEAKLQNGILSYIQGVSAGTVTLTATSPDSRTCAVSVELEVTGEERSYAVNGGNIYYNPATGIITRADSTVTDVTIPSQINGTTITGIAPCAFAKRNFYGNYFYFEDNTTLTYIKLPDTVTFIGDYAFSYCKSLATLKLGSGLTTIGERAFMYCKSLSSLTIPDSVSTIGDAAFYNLNGLKYLTLSGEWDTREWLSFGGNTLLETVTFTGSTVISQPVRVNGNYTSVDSMPGRNAKKIIISDSVTAIEGYAFYNCSKITSVTVGSGVRSIGDYAFYGCNALTSVTIGSGVRSIGDYAFYWCDALTSITLPEGLTSIGKGAFFNCISLTSINLPESLTFIGASCFESCTKLQLIDLSAIPDVIMAKETNLTNKAIVPAVLVSATGGKASLHWNTYQSEGEILNVWEIAGVYSRDNMKNWLLEARSTGKVILECRDEYTGARGFKEISIETGIELRGAPDYLVSGKNVTLTSYRMPDNIQENVTWSLREEDKAYASLSTSYGKTTKLTAKTVDRAVEVQLTATPNSGTDETVLNIWILPKATGVTIFEGENTAPVGQTGMSVQTLSVDMHTSNTLTLSAQMQPVGALETVTWKSSDTKIATVADGVVTLKKPGTVTISATAQDSTNKSASVKLAVTYLESASELTAKAEVPAIGLQETFSTTMLVYGTDKEVALHPENLTFSIPESQQQIATVDENGVITAGSKAGTATVTAAITDDPLNRKVSVKVKVIAAQTEYLFLPPEAGAPAEIVMLDINGNVTEDAEKVVRYNVYLDKDDVQSGVFSFLIRPSAKNTIGEDMALAKSSLTWTSTDTRVATVKSNADSSVTVTVKAKTDGACAINAVTTDYAKVENDLTIYVRDYAPRLETTSLTLNSYRWSGVTASLVESYGNQIADISLHEYDSKTKTYLEETSARLIPSYADGLLTITHQDTITNSTIKLLLKIVCENGETYEYPISVKVSNSLPAITIKQGTKFNLYTGNLAELTVTAKDTAVTNVALDSLSTTSFQQSGFDAGTQVLSLEITDDYRNGSVLDTKVDILVELEDYREPARKSVTISTTTNTPSITIKQPAKFNLFYTDSIAELAVTAKNLNVTDVKLDAGSTKSFEAVSFDKETGILTVAFTDEYIRGEAGKLDSAVNLLVYLEDYNTPISKSVTISTTTTKPSLSLTPAFSIINTAIASDKSAYFQVYNKTEDAYVSLSTDDVTASFADVAANGDTVTLTVTETDGVANKGGIATVTVQESNWMSAIKLTHKVTVETKLPIPALSTSTLKLNRIFAAQTAAAVVSLNQNNLSIDSVAIEPTAKEGSTARIQAEKIDLSYNTQTGIITASIPNDDDAPNNGTYEFRYVVTLNDAVKTVLPAKTFKVNVHSTTPGVKLKTTTVILNTLLSSYDEIAETAVSMINGSGYQLVGFQLPEDWNENIAIGFDENTGVLSAQLLSSEVTAKKYTCKLMPVLYHEETGQTVTLPSTVSLTVQIHTTLPTPKLVSSTLKLNRIFTEQTASTKVTLNLPLAQIGTIDFASTAREGTATREQADKIHLTYDPNTGSIIAAILDGEDAPKNGTYEYRYTTYLTDGEPLKEQKMKVNVHSTVPGIKFTTSTLKLNKVLATQATAETSVSLTNGSGYELTGFAELTGWSNELIDLAFDKDTATLSATLLDETAANKTHSFKLTPILTHVETGQEVTMSSQVTLNVQIFSGKLSVSLSAKGKLDTMDPDSGITYTVNKFTNVSGTPNYAKLAGQDAELFCAELDTSGSKPVVQLTMDKDGSYYSANKTYKLQLILGICGQETTSSISFKVSQSGLKFTSIPTLKLYHFQTLPVTCNVALSSPITAQLENIELNKSKTSSEFLRAMGSGTMDVTMSEDGRSAVVSFQMKNPGYLVYGKSYTVYLDITPENNASNVKPTQLKVTVKTYK